MRISIKKRLSFLYRFLSKLRMHLTRDKVFELSYGGRILVNKYSYVERKIEASDFEVERSGFIAGLMSREVVFVDIGANVGFYSMIAAFKCGQVWAFEPEPINYQRLIANVAVNQGSPAKIRTFQVALGSEAGVGRLNRPLTDNYGMATFGGLKAGDFVEVPIVRLDSVLKLDGDPHLFKVDVEGFELSVLAGAVGVHNKLPKGSIWLVEVHIGCGVKYAEVADYFAGNGYSVSCFDDKSGKLVHTLEMQGDVLLVATKT